MEYAGAPYTPHPTPYTLHPQPCTLNPTTQTLNQERAALSSSVAHSASAATAPGGTERAADGAAAIQVVSLEEALRGAREECARLRAEMDAKV